MQITRRIVSLLTIVLLATAAPASAKKVDYDQLSKDVKEAMANFKEKDKTFESAVNKARGYVIFPEVGKGGFIVGGAGGYGEVYENGKLIGHSKLSQGSVGAQIGGTKFSEIILFQKAKAMNRFKKGKFELAAQATANAADQGAAAKAKYTDGVKILILAISGLMADASVGGQKLEFMPLEGN